MVLYERAACKHAEQEVRHRRRQGAELSAAGGQLHSGHGTKTSGVSFFMRANVRFLLALLPTRFPLVRLALPSLCVVSRTTFTILNLTIDATYRARGQKARRVSANPRVEWSLDTMNGRRAGTLEFTILEFLHFRYRKWSFAQISTTTGRKFNSHLKETNWGHETRVTLHSIDVYVCGIEIEHWGMPIDKDQLCCSHNDSFYYE